MSQLVEIDNSVELRDGLNMLLTSQGDGTGRSAQDIAPVVVASASDASPNVYTSVAHGLVDNDYVFVKDEAGSTTANGIRKITAAAADTFQLTTPGLVAINSNGVYTGNSAQVYVAFVYAPGSTEVAVLKRLVGYAHGTSYDPAKYLSIAQLSDGIEVRVYQDDTNLKTLTATPVTVWPQWTLDAGVDIGDTLGGGVEVQCNLRWTFVKGPGAYKVKGHLGQFIAMIIKDDLSTLLAQEMSVQGKLSA